MKKQCQNCRFSELIDDYNWLRCVRFSYKTEDYGLLCVNQEEKNGHMPKSDILVLPNFGCNRFEPKDG